MHVLSPRRLALFTATGLAAFIATSPAAAQAQDVDGGIYVTGRVGAALPSDFNLEGVQDPQGASPGAAGAPANVETQLDSDVTFSGAIGYKLPTRLFGVIEPSFEIEYTNTSLDVDGGSFDAVPGRWAWYCRRGKQHPLFSRQRERADFWRDRG